MKKLLFLLFITHYSLLIANAQVNQDWVARYNGPGNSIDEAYSIAVDGSGNVYVTGQSLGSGTNNDYATIKYNSTGVQQWASRYNGPANSGDGSTSIAVDGSGNVYVTGASVGSGTVQDYATIKYNSSGVEQWVARYNGPGNGFDASYSLAVDGSGNVYVTGASVGSGTVQDYATIKYNSSGVQQWVSRYNGPGNSIDIANSLAVDGSGNVYVTGRSEQSNGNYDYATIKYNSSGDSIWVRRYNGPGNIIDEANSIAVDGSGNVYVTGSSLGIVIVYDYATIKYNSSGVQQWVARYNGPGNDYDNAFSLAVDGSGNVYVTGSSRSGVTSGTADYATIKYNSSGVQQWVQRYNGPANGFDGASSLALDSSGNVYVTGNSLSGTNYDYATIKYNSLGDSIWVRRYNGPGNGVDDAYSLAVDGPGNVYVTGSSVGSGTNYDYATIKYKLFTAPALFSPPNNSQGWGLTVLLIWYRVLGAVNYHVQVSTDSLFANIILNDSTVTDSTKGVGGLQNNTWYFWRVAAKAGLGTGPWSAVWKFRTGFVGIQPVTNEIPKEFKLYDNYPNPFNPTTKIRFALPKSSFAKLVIYDILGREAETLVNEQLNAGIYEADWNAKNFSSGVYIYKLSAGEFVDTKKMVLTR
jgi:uncharacterized delta-60 repeat protein